MCVHLADLTSDGRTGDRRRRVGRVAEHPRHWRGRVSPICFAPFGWELAHSLGFLWFDFEDDAHFPRLTKRIFVFVQVLFRHLINVLVGILLGYINYSPAN